MSSRFVFIVMALILVVACENKNQASKDPAVDGGTRCLKGMEMDGKYILACDGQNQAQKVSVECFNKTSQTEETTLGQLRSNGCLAD